MITLDLSILNQKGTPMFNSDIFANRPAAGVVGRIFISTDTKVFYRDTGTTWELVGGSGSGTITGSGTAGTLPIWTGSSALGDSSLLEGSTKISTIKDIQADGYYLTGMTAGSGALYWTSDRVTLANYNVGGSVVIETNGGPIATTIGPDYSLTNNGYIAAVPTLTAANNASSLALYGINTLTYAAGFSSNNIGALYGGIAGFNLQTFAGSATFAQANVASGGASVNSIDFSSAGSTITMTQSSGIRVMSGQQNLFQYQGTNSGTITHAAISQNTGFYRPSAASGTLTITNAYSHLINALDDYGAGFTFTNRWGIYQAGASDKNYFAANVLLGSVVDNGNRFQLTGNGYVSGNFGIGTTAAALKLDVTFSSAGDGIRSYNTLSTGFADVRVGNNTNNNLGYLRVGGSAIGDYTADSFVIGTGGGYDIKFAPQGTLRATLNTDGNLGLGVIPSAWKIGWKTIQLSSSSITSDGAQYQTGFNFYLNQSGNDIYINSDTATKYQQVLGQHIFYNAPSGTAGNAISFTQAMTLDSSGRLSIGTTAGSTYPFGGLLNVAGNISVSTGKIGFGITDAFTAYGSSTAQYGISYNGSTNPIAISGYFGIGFFADGSEKLRLATTGNFLINSTTDPGQKLYLNGSLRIDGQSSATSGGNSGQHLIINLDGTTYKIRLELP